MYSNGVRVNNVANLNDQGYLTKSEWVWHESGAAGLQPASSYSRGEAIFRGECGSCHTLQGYRALNNLLAGRDHANIANFINMLHENQTYSPYRRFMPPMVGTKKDVEDLTNYLNAQVNPQAPRAPKAVLTAQK
jgi:mono/diheme cytochrome c family protein